MIYKRSFFRLLFSIVCWIFSVGLVYVISNLFTGNNTIIYSAVSIVILIALYSVVISDDLKLEVDGIILKHYVKNKLKGEYDITKHSLSYSISSTNGLTNKLDLILYNPEKNEEYVIDCEPIGRIKFDDLYDAIYSISIDSNKPTVTETIKKKEN